MHPEWRYEVRLCKNNVNQCVYIPFVRYASVEEKLSSSDSHLREKIKEVQMLQLEVLILSIPI